MQRTEPEAIGLSFDLTVDGLDSARPESVLPRELFTHLINISNDMLLKYPGIAPERHAAVIVEMFRDNMARRVMEKGQTLTLSQRLLNNHRWLHCVSAWANGALVNSLWRQKAVWVNPAVFTGRHPDEIEGDHIVVDTKHPTFRLLRAIKRLALQANGLKGPSLETAAHKLAIDVVVDAAAGEWNPNRVQFKPARWPICSTEGSW
jgi:hypothetical protein